MAFTKKRARILGALILLAAAAALYVFVHRGEVSTDDAAIDATIVTISPRVSGYVKNLYVHDNQTVKAGDVLVEIDPADYQIALDRAEATLEGAKAALAAAGQTLEIARIAAPSNTEAAQAQVGAAQADWENAARALKRQRSLNDEARSRQQLEDAVAAEKRALSVLNDAKAKLRASTIAPQTVAAAQSNGAELAAIVKEAEADVAQAKKNLADTKLTAPFAGRISNRNVDRGAYLQVGQQLMALVGADYWVTANFKETQLHTMRVGQRVEIDVDAYPDLDLHGRVDSVQAGAGAVFSAFPSENATGNFVKIVQRVPVKILIDGTIDSKYALGPGMSVVPTVHTR